MKVLSALTIEPRTTACATFVNPWRTQRYVLLHLTLDGCTLDFIAGKTASWQRELQMTIAGCQIRKFQLFPTQLLQPFRSIPAVCDWAKSCRGSHRHLTHW